MASSQAFAADLPDRDAVSAWLAWLVRGGTLASVASLLLISEMVLAHFGFNYGEAGGSFAEKLHPATWLSLATLAATMLRPNGWRQIVDALCRQYLILFYLCAWVALIAFTTLVAKRPFTPLIDTFLTPLMIYLLVTECDDWTRRRLTVLLHVILIANAMLGIFEYVTGWRLTPLMLGSELITYEWRAGAFLGHPLTNAAITGCHLVALAAGGGWKLPKFALPGVIVLELMAMAAFGGRSSLVISVAVLAGAGLWSLVGIARGGRIDKLTAAIMLMSLPPAMGMFAYASETGFFDRLVDRFMNDQGSANTRLVMLKLFDLIPTTDLILGPDQSYVSALQRVEGIELGIESFWVSFIMQNGILMSAVMFAALAMLWTQLVRMTRVGAIFPVIVFISAVSASVSISAKSVMLAQFVSLVLTVMRRPDPDEEHMA